MINWNVRLRNKKFVLQLTASVILALQIICRMLGLSFDVSKLTADIMDLTNVIFVILTLIGVVNDPTTHGMGDSERALEYKVPKK